MIPVAQLDSATLALWLNLSPLYSSPHKQTFETAILAAARGDVNAALKALASFRSTRPRIRGLHLTSLVWHEQRHFLDLVATNYGAHRFRYHAAVYQNVLVLLADQAAAGSPLIMPVQYHVDLFAHRKGISSGPGVKDQVKSIMRKRAAARADHLQIAFGDRTVDVGGEQVLEALGFLHQHWSVANVSNGELAFDVLTDLPQRLQRNAVYEWPIVYMRALEIAPPDELRAYPIFDGVRLLSAILLASLFVPFMDTSAGSRGVAERLEMLWAEFRGDEARRLRSAPFEDCWAAVSAAARRLWGHSLEEDLEHDLMLQDQRWIRPLRAQFTYDVEPAPVDFVAEYQALRESVLERLKADGPGFLDPTRGPTSDCGPIVLPTPISVWPASRSRPPDGHVSLFGGTAQTDPESEPFTSWTWGWTPERWPPEGIEDPLAFKSGDSWRKVVRIHAPAAKLLLNGFQHRTMLGPELEQALEYMRSFHDVEVHPHFGYSPAETSDLDQLFFLSESEHLICDVCNGFVHEGQGKIVSPTEIRSNKRSAAAAQAAYERRFANVPGAQLQASMDWSGWVTCEVCIDLLRPQRRSAKAEAREIRAMAERLSNLATQRSEVDTAMLAVAAAIQRDGDFEEAAKRYRHLVDNGDPETVPLAALSLGVVSQSLRRPADARAAYEIAMDDRWPHPSAKAAYNLGTQNQQEGNLHEAARCFSRAIEIDDPEVTPTASQSLAKILHELGDREGSVRAYERAHTNANDDAETVAEAKISRALALIGTGSYPEALDFLYDVMTGPVKGPAARAAATGTLVAVTTNDIERREAFLSHMFRLCGEQQIKDVMTALGYRKGETI